MTDECRDDMRDTDPRIDDTPRKAVVGRSHRTWRETADHGCDRTHDARHYEALAIGRTPDSGRRWDGLIGH